MTDRYDPPEDKVRQLVETRTPRELAIAYLRATRRARQSDAAFRALDKITGARDAVMAGDDEAALRELRSALAGLRTEKEASE